jgi:hypothetical protein
MCSLMSMAGGAQSFSLQTCLQAEGLLKAEGLSARTVVEALVRGDHYVTHSLGQSAGLHPVIYTLTLYMHCLPSPAVCLAGYEPFKSDRCKACGPDTWSAGNGAPCQRCSCPLGPCQATSSCSPTTGQCSYINKGDGANCGPSSKCNKGVCTSESISQRTGADNQRSQPPGMLYSCVFVWHHVHWQPAANHVSH